MDITAREDVSRVLREYKVKSIVHAAVRSEKGDTGLYQAMDVNVTGTINVLEAAHRADIHRVLFISSEAVYQGMAQTAPFKEEERLYITSDRFVPGTKKGGEILCLMYSQEHKMEALSVRLTRVYGPLYTGIRNLPGHMLEKAGQGLPIELGPYDPTEAHDFIYSKMPRAGLTIPDGEITATLINGAIRMSNQEKMARVLRKKSRLIIAHGSCAHLGGVVGLANFFECRDILNRAFKDVPTMKNSQGVRPLIETSESGRELQLPGFYNTVKTLDQVIEVDYYIPGCPPTPQLIKKALMAIFQDRLPVKGSVLSEQKALCYFCSRKESKPDVVRIKRIKRLYENEWDPTRCFLDQGLW